MLDVFKTDAFSMVSLTAAINKLPHRPTRIGDLGLFRESGIATTTAVVEWKSGQLSLISTSPRGGPGSTLAGDLRSARSFLVPHLQRESTVMADEVQGVRAFGSENAVEAVQMVVQQRLATLRAMHDATLEYHRVGAIKGVILDANGSTAIYNLFTEFSLSQQTLAMDFSATDVRSQCVAAMRLSEAELGAEPVSGYIAFCGDTFFDTLVESTDVKDTFKYQEGQALRTDWRRGVEFGGIRWENYRGKVYNAAQSAYVDYFDDEEAYLVPLGTDIFQTWFAPADFIETVNTLGLPLYAKMADDPSGLNRQVTIHAQSNPLCMNTRPRAVIKLTLAT